jgi:3-oxoacyl-[acyl-carrier protein] reductase
VREVAAEGYRAIAVGRKPTAGLDDLRQAFPGCVEFVAFDLAEVEGIHDLVGTVVREHGRPRGLVNNAAVGHDGVLATQHEREIRDLLRINVEAPILLAKYFLRPMLIERGGRIVNIASIIATTGFSGLSVYAASKAAMIGFTHSLAREVGKAGITVNAVAPGYMETDMTAGLEGEKLAAIRRRSPLGRLVRPEEVAHAVVYLLSAKASAITGTTLTVDAGSTA